MTKTQLNKDLKAAETEHDKLQWSYHTDPEVIKTKAALDEAIKNAQEKAKDRLSQIYLKMKEIKAQLKAIEKAKEEKKPQVPQSVQDLINRLHSGVDWGAKGLIFEWVSSTGRFVILRNPGSGYSSGRDWLYGKSKHYLLDFNAKCLDNGYELFIKTKVFEHEGRLPKDVLNQWKIFASKSEDKIK